MSDPLHLRREYRPNHDRCVKALLALLRSEPHPTPPADTAGAGTDPGEAGEDLRTSTSEEENPCADHADRLDVLP